MAPNPGEVIVYEQADHGFALDPADSRHDELAAADAQTKVRVALSRSNGLDLDADQSVGKALEIAWVGREDQSAAGGEGCRDHGGIDVML